MNFPRASRQPWSAYAVHLTTLSPPALLGDLLLVWLCHKATVTWGDVLHDQAMTLLYLWIFSSKWIKLLGHYIRYPVDVFLIPVSILFGYFHGAIKMYAVMTLNVVCIVFFFYFRVSHFFTGLADCGLPQMLACPSFPYDRLASRRFDHDSSFLHFIHCTSRPSHFF